MPPDAGGLVVVDHGDLLLRIGGRVPFDGPSPDGSGDVAALDGARALEMTMLADALATWSWDAPADTGDPA